VCRILLRVITSHWVPCFIRGNELVNGVVGSVGIHSMRLKIPVLKFVTIIIVIPWHHAAVTLVCLLDEIVWRWGILTVKGLCGQDLGSHGVIVRSILLSVVAAHRVTSLIWCNELMDRVVSSVGIHSMSLQITMFKLISVVVVVSWHHSAVSLVRLLNEIVRRWSVLTVKSLCRQNLGSHSIIVCSVLLGVIAAHWVTGLIWSDELMDRVVSSVSIHGMRLKITMLKLIAVIVIIPRHHAAVRLTGLLQEIVRRRSVLTVEGFCRQNLGPGCIVVRSILLRVVAAHWVSGLIGCNELMDRVISCVGIHGMRLQVTILILLTVIVFWNHARSMGCLFLDQSCWPAGCKHCQCCAHDST